MVVYRSFHRLAYTLRTDDIDFAVEVARNCETDIPEILRKLEYLPLMDLDGLEKFIKGTFSIEFLVHRQGGKDAPYVPVKKMKIRALPLPFMSMLYLDPITVDLQGFSIRIPGVETLFLHKLIVAQRRIKESKKLKDLDQCKSLIPVIDAQKLAAIASTQQFSKNTKAAILKSVEAIGYSAFL
ncbi:hypothetical protein JFN90_09800 [Geomonas sp. Red259]|uniref:Nucleotidyltransferase-like domain-containing protein n=2 Tax=Geomonas propionica TaxID=2798582 RepID=A0ABS0YR69_9BACT|nr:hypothetical protein [Geomonas propionica]